MASLPAKELVPPRIRRLDQPLAKPSSKSVPVIGDSWLSDYRAGGKQPRRPLGELAGRACR
jgi:hypothetical protein